MIVSLDIKDRKILAELDKNSRQSLKKIGKKVRLSPEVVFHRMKKLEKSGVIKRYQTIASISALGFFAPKIYLQLQSIPKQKFEELQKYLMNHKRIFWYGLCQGRWDLIIAYWSRTPDEFGEQLDELLNKFSQYISERQVTIGKNTIQYNNRWLYSESNIPVGTDFGNPSDENLDEESLEILKYLANNGRMPATEIARRMELTANVVQYKTKQMEKKKIIAGYKFQLDAHKVGFESCKSFIYFKNISEKRKKQLIEYIKLNPNVINIVLCVGPWDMEIEFEVENFDRFYDLMEDIKENFQDIIKNYESVVFRDEPKKSFVPDCYPKIA